MTAACWRFPGTSARTSHADSTPFAPPSYHDRVIAQVNQVIDHYVAEGKPVIVGAHSQGTIICAAALAKSGHSARAGFLTYGSPLSSLHERFFPAEFSPQYVASLNTRTDAGWINLWRDTDPIAGPIGFCQDDRCLDDPRVLGHAGYWHRDERDFVRAIEDLSVRLGVGSEPTEQI